MYAKRYIVFSLLINGIIPWLMYVVLSHWLTSILALTIATLVPLADNLLHIWKHRKLDALGSLMLFTFVLTLVLAMLGGSEKLLLIRKSVSNVVLYGFIGAAILWTVWYRRRSAKKLAAMKLRAAEGASGELRASEESCGGIFVLRPEHLPEALDLYWTVTERLRQQGIHQWDRYYPNRFVIKQDIAHGCLYGIRDQGRLIAAVAVNRQQSDKYASISWSDAQGNPAIIHRLAVHPAAQGKGIGKQLLAFAESHARQSGYTSVRLDVYSANPSAVSMYERYGYTHKGEIQFPFRKAPYFCMEKVW